MKRIHIWCLLFLVLMTISYQVSAWGAVAHETVCEIAVREMTPKARKALKLLLKQDPDYSTFAKSCTWADEPTQRARRKSDHFITVPRHYFKVQASDCRTGSTCLFSAIRHDANKLVSNADAAKRLSALKYLAHWVADIHQPLHVAFGDDHAGNKVMQSGGSCDGSLHHVWDTCIVEKRIGMEAKDNASDLISWINTSADRGHWIDSTVVDWADESYNISRNPRAGYCDLDGSNRCWYQGADNRRYEKDQSPRFVVVDKAYLDWAEPLVRERLARAGVRLGALLSQLLAPEDFEKQNASWLE